MTILFEIDSQQETLLYDTDLEYFNSNSLQIQNERMLISYMYFNAITEK